MSNLEPQPILQQQKSLLTTNAFIPDNIKMMELNDIQNNVNNIIQNEYNKNITSSIQNLSLSDINRNISESCIGVLDDILNKPKNIAWIEYVQIILKKKQRYTYIGIMLIFIAFFILIVSK
jgi:hypoxanthine-guanine phosphoribosyltransferase